MAFFAASATEAISPSEVASEMSLASVRSSPSPSPRLEVDEKRPSLIVGSSGPEGNLPALNMVIRQDPFSMTLDANALLAGSLFLLMGMHLVPRPLLESSILAAPILLLIQNDYQNFLRLGPGGTPPTLAGYARLAWFRLFILRDPFSPPPLPPPPSSSSSSSSAAAALRPATGILASQNLPYRPGPRPTVAGLAPQRQLNQHGSHGAFTALKRTLTALAARFPDRFGTATSCIEKHGFALFARHPVNVCGNGEVCHIHNSDRSMHMNLHPEDIAEVLSKGWGQRHPMAWGRSPRRQFEDGKRGWWSPMRVQSPLPETFVLVYSPRGE